MVDPLRPTTVGPIQRRCQHHPVADLAVVEPQLGHRGGVYPTNREGVIVQHGRLDSDLSEADSRASLPTWIGHLLVTKLMTPLDRIEGKF